MALETVTELRVRYAETDQMGVVYHANYLVWCEIGRTDFIRAVGTPYAELERQGVFLAVSEAALRFHASARYEDPVRVYTTLVDVQSRAMTFHYRIVQAATEVTLVTATTALVSLTPAGKLTALPIALRDLLRSQATPSPSPSR
ncbi:MAG: acyl-CoA thioesterase [Gemmatimonadaceae bacterium]|nr:acyl-CoA thioesterase [Gemmatimonadaceae bacterium]